MAEKSVYHDEAFEYATNYVKEKFPDSSHPYREGSEEIQLWMWAYSRRINELLNIKIVDPA